MGRVMQDENSLAVILAAGVGSRLLPLTESRAKCLVSVAGIPILGRQLAALKKAGIAEVTIVAGHCAQDVIEYCRTISEPRVTVIDNVEFRETNNMYSLYLTREKMEGRHFLLLNGDVAIRDDVIVNARSSGHTDFIVAEKGNHNLESMKIQVDQDGFIRDISKCLKEEVSYGTSIDLYSFSAQSSTILFAEIRNIIEGVKDRNQWTEVALRNILTSGKVSLRPVDVDGGAWVEVDNFEDLAEADEKFSALDYSLESYRAIFIDLDGTVYLGNTPIPGAKEFVSYLHEKDIRHFFISNNSSHGKDHYRTKLQHMGISAVADEIILSTDSLITNLLTQNIRKVFAVGTRDFVNELHSKGIECVEEGAQAVVLGYDTELTYEKLKIACLLLQQPGMPYLASHCDIVCPTEKGPIPDIGCIIALFEAATGRRPDVVFGKPDPSVIKDALERYGITPEETLLIGDRVYTDGLLAHRSGCDFACVLSGETDRPTLETVAQPPKAILKSLNSFLRESCGLSNGKALGNG
ncbi:MAG: HAD-IIA family hydrolase [Desulforhabdus sp.]|jgi:HAD superfamily hydrolase (TIGR01450 family)|nr:HAD-IIA family hydrolase [Desulforhabdus sp.]